MNYDTSIHTNPDAQAWAKFFMQTMKENPSIVLDESLVTAWFANAMMAMHDHLKGGGPINGDHAQHLIDTAQIAPKPLPDNQTAKRRVSVRLSARLGSNATTLESNMTTMIQQYQGAKREHDYCAAWAALIGKKYNGGGGGIGELTSLSLMSGEAAPTVYHQYSDGAKNYHTMPAALAPHLEAAIKARFGELLADAMERQKAALKQAAEAAVKEHGELLKAAGIDA